MPRRPVDQVLRSDDGAGELLERFRASLDPDGGTLAFVALPADNTMQLPIFETVLNATHVVGSIVGTRVDLAECLELHARKRTRVVYERRKLEDVNRCLDEVEHGKVAARLVFTFA